MRISPSGYRSALLACALSLTGCGGNDGGSPPPAPSLRALATEKGMSSALPVGVTQVRPDSDPLVKVGQLLFFSTTLSGGYDVACATCHLPDNGGGDGLSLAVGVSAVDPSVIGPGRVLDPATDLDPSRDGGPNVARNSQTVFNVALYSRALLHDGRVFVGDDARVPGGAGQHIITPDSGSAFDPRAGNNLLAAQSRFPVIANTEMRGFRYPELADPDAYRQLLVRRLRGEVETDKLSAEGPANWLTLFRAAYGDGSAAELITSDSVQQALAAYQASLVFVDTPWRNFLGGNEEALSPAAARGAALFLTSPDSGGAGCVTCHGGNHFTNEGFYNVGFPQIGRGKRSDRTDIGRLNVNPAMSRDEFEYAFRVPSLLNVALTAPYGHDGSFATLEDVIAYHANPQDGVDAFDFTLRHLPQFAALPANQYPKAEAFTRSALASPSFLVAAALLPQRNLSADEIDDLRAFLLSLTDVCAGDSACRADWVPQAGEDPDGNMLGGANAPVPPVDEVGRYPALVVTAFRGGVLLDGFADTSGCALNTAAVNNATSGFLRRDAALGLDDPHGFSADTWLRGNGGSDSALHVEATMFAGAVTAGYLSGTCWPDIVFAGGDTSGVIVYRNRGAAGGFDKDVALFEATPNPRVASVGIADLNGDFRREIVLGNLHAGAVSILSPDDSGMLYAAASLPVSRTTYGVAFADYNGDGMPEMYMGHWSREGVPGSAPAFWLNNLVAGTLVPFDAAAGTSAAYINQNWNFTPGFADFDDDGLSDLAIASDFGTSVVMRNGGAGSFANVTDRAVIKDKNGMGAVIADFDNDQKLDWFVDSITLPGLSAAYNYSIGWGNQLYWNNSGDAGISFQRASLDAGVSSGGWAWGACAADFDNDGFQDIFHVNGYGYIPQSLRDLANSEFLQPFNDLELFRGSVPRMFVNNGNGTFTDEASSWGFEASEGRGVACFDSDRDGDVDIVLVDQSTGLQFYENHQGHGAGRRFLDVRLVGKQPNTDALGAKVYVTADTGAHGVQTMLRTSAANSNFGGQNLPDLHFGLGSATTVQQMRIVWPDGSELVCAGLQANRFVVIDQRMGGGSGTCPAGG